MQQKKTIKRVLLTGQCTLHWGRMEFGNVGNYYIIEPLVREMHRIFPDCEIVTTFQMSNDFCNTENVICLPMELYYAWSGSDLQSAQDELTLARQIQVSSNQSEVSTPYISEVRKADVVVDFSGDIWGANADCLGMDRFMVGLCKNRVAQVLGKPTAMIAGSPGPFTNSALLPFAREVYSGFDLVTNRENVSAPLMAPHGFNLSRTIDCACPAFLFEGEKDETTATVDLEVKSFAKGRPVVGFILCGWNFGTGPFDRWPRHDSEYEVFVNSVEHLCSELGACVVMMSHANGFDVPPAPFRLTHGRDYPIVKQLAEILAGKSASLSVMCLDGVYTPKQTKEIIRGFDMLVSGRVHGAVAGLSQCVPTVVIDYGHEPKAHKLRGFAEVAGVGDFVADPAGELWEKIRQGYLSRHALRAALAARMPAVKSLAKENFDRLADAVACHYRNP